MLIHGTAVALKDGRAWRALVLRGPPGSGKSDLALRLIDAGGRLIADDQTRLVNKNGVLTATVPAAIAGMMEVRGIGIARLGRGQTMTAARLALLVDLVPPATIERLPDADSETLLGVAVRRIALAPFEASAAVKLRIALRQR